MGTNKMSSSSSDALLVLGPERSRALDTASILGGNEFMLSQTFHELHDKMFTSEDLELLKWALGVVWADYEMEYKSQRSFTNLFLPNLKENLQGCFQIVCCMECKTMILSFGPTILTDHIEF